MLLRPRPFLALASLTGLGTAGSLPVGGLEVSHAEGAISAQRVAAKQHVPRFRPGSQRRSHDTEGRLAWNGCLFRFIRNP